MAASMMAIKKPTGGVRGMATATVSLVGLENSLSPIREGSGNSVCTSPVRPFHQGWN